MTSPQGPTESGRRAGWNAVLALIAAPAGKDKPIQERFPGWDLWDTVSAVDDSSETVVSITRSWAGADPMVATGRGRQVNIILYNVVASNAVIHTGFAWAQHDKTVSAERRVVRKYHAAVVTVITSPILDKVAVARLALGQSASSSSQGEVRIAFWDLSEVLGPTWPAVLQATRTIVETWMDQKTEPRMPSP